jgi:hypothetical protein
MELNSKILTNKENYKMNFLFYQNLAKIIKTRAGSESLDSACSGNLENKNL